MQSRRGLILSMSDFFGGMISFFGRNDAICSSLGRRSDTRSFFTGRLSGPMVLQSVASCMQASTGSPFTRTAQDPHWPEAQE